MLRMGILGAARIASALAPAIHAASGAELVGVAARDKSRAEDFAKRHDIPQVFDSYDALLASDAIDAVYIPLPNDLHAPWAIRALEAGKHVLLEKPSAMNSAETARVLKVAAAHKKVVFEGFMYRYHPQFARAVEIIQAGTIGELRLIRSSFSFTLPPENTGDHRWIRSQGGGGLYDLGCYCLNASVLFMNESPQEVTARATWGSRPDVPENEFVDLEFAALMTFSGSRHAVFDCSLQQKDVQKLELVGTKGTINMEGFVFPAQDGGRIMVNGATEQTAPADRYQRMVEHFARVIAGTETPRFDAPDQPTSALPQMRALEALWESAQANGQTVKL
jgi:D-xylose 1-dehydrogenase (NADP+, D-xylono-1,5-lactone-forming)